MRKFLDELGIGELLSFIVIFCYLCYRILPFAVACAGIVVVCGIYVWSLTTKFSYWTDRGVAGPKQNIFFGNTLQMRNGFVDFDKKATDDFGPTFGTFFLGKPQLVTSDLDLLRQVVVKDFPNFANRRIIRGIHDNKYSPFAHGLTVLKDQRWKDVRATVTPAFTTGKMKNMLPIFNSCAEILLKKLDAHAKNGTDFVAKHVFGGLTMDVISKSAFGVDVDAQHGDSVFVRNAKKIFDFTFTDPAVIFSAAFPNLSTWISNTTKRQLINHEINAFFTEAVNQVIAQREKNPRIENPDFLQILLNTMKNDDNNNEKDIDLEITHEAISKTGKKVKLLELEIVAQSFLFLIAGYETTASTLQFIAYELAHNPEIQEKCHRQIMEAVGDRDTVTYEDLVKLPYLEQVMMEALRMYPPATRFDRECKETITLNGIRFNEGDGIAAAVSVIHNNPEYYPNPEQFDPERFSTEERSRRDPLTFLAFGYGPRNCIGMRFSQLEIRLTLAAILKRYKFVCNEKTPKKPLRLNTAGLTKPLDPVILSVEKR